MMRKLLNEQRANHVIKIASLVLNLINSSIDLLNAIHLFTVSNWRIWQHTRDSVQGKWFNAAPHPNINRSQGYSRQQKVWRTFSRLHTSTKSVNKRFECSMRVAPNLMYSTSLYTYYYYKYLLNKIEKIPRNMCSSLILYFQICKHFKLLFLKVFVWYFLFRRLDKFTMGHVYFLLSHYFESCARILQLFTFIVMNIARPYATGKNSPNFLLATVL